MIILQKILSQLVHCILLCLKTSFDEYFIDIILRFNEPSIELTVPGVREHDGVVDGDGPESTKKYITTDVVGTTMLPTDVSPTTTPDAAATTPKTQKTTTVHDDDVVGLLL